MENDKILYPSGSTALFHAAAVRVAPIWCDTCMKDTAEFIRDAGRFEVYECPHCKMQRDIAVRFRLMADDIVPARVESRDTMSDIENFLQHQQGCRKSSATFDNYGIMRTYPISCSCGHDKAAAELSQLRRDLADAKAQRADLYQLTGAEMIIEDEQKAGQESPESEREDEEAEWAETDRKVFELARRGELLDADGNPVPAIIVIQDGAGGYKHLGMEDA